MTVASPLEGDLPRWVTAAGARHLSWRARRSPGPSVPGEALRLSRIVRAAAPDLVHLHSAKAGLAGRLALRGKLPTVFQPHAWSFLAAGGPVATAALKWERLAARWADAIVCVSEAERRQGSEAGIDGRWVVVPNGVDLEAFRPGDKQAARAALRLNDGPLVVCVGRLSRQKGQDVLLEAWPRVREGAPGARLVLVGGGPDEASLRSAAPEGVIFAGVTTEVPSWMAAADVVALPSRWEGMSLAMLEALAAGRSIVISDVPGAREAIEGGAGVVVPIEDPAALADALSARLADPALAEAEGREGRRIAEERFGLERNLERIAEVYEDVLVARRAGDR